MNGTKIGPFRQTNMYRLARMLVDSASDALKPVFNKLGGEFLGAGRAELSHIKRLWP